MNIEHFCKEIVIADCFILDLLLLIFFIDNITEITGTTFRTAPDIYGTFEFSVSRVVYKLLRWCLI